MGVANLQCVDYENDRLIRIWNDKIFLKLEI